MQALKDLANLLYPPACVLCHKSQEDSPGATSGEGLFCNACRQNMMRCDAPVCQQCGIAVAAAFDAVVKCRECLARPRLFELARAPWQYRGAVQQVVHQLKYAQRWRLGNWLAEDMAAVARQTFPIERVDFVVPVPSHWIRKRLRGFDPTATLACQAAKCLGLPYLPKALKRVRWTRSQTRLSWAKRLRNMHHAFRANAGLVKGQSILLIDDVLTTTATAESCCSALRFAGAQEVFVLTAARTPLN